MAKQINVSVGGVVKKVKEVPLGVGGVVKKAKSGVAGVAGVVREYFSQGLIIYDNGDNPFKLAANGKYSSVESNYLQVKDQTSYVNLYSNAHGGARFYSEERFPYASLSEFTKLCVTLDSGSTYSLYRHHFGVYFGFPLKENPSHPLCALTAQVYASFRDDNEIISGKRTVSMNISDMAFTSNYEKYCSSYGLPFIRVTEYTDYQSGDDYAEYKMAAMKIYKIWLE